MADRDRRESSSVAMVTLVTSDSFLPAAQVLIFSFRRFHNDIPVVVLVTPNVSKVTRVILKRTGATVTTVESIENPHLASNANANSNWTNCGFTKLRIWSLTQYDKIVYIDADCVVLSEISNLFTVDLGSIGFAAAPDIFPPDCFNAGVLVICPSMVTFKNLVSEIDVLRSYDGGDTGFLNAYFNNWFNLGKENRLDFSYNAQRTMHWMTHSKQPGYWNSVENRPIRILHFSSTPKPWEQNSITDATDAKKSKLGELEMQWWLLYNEMSLTK
uniref:Hexosyltransferase n=1 Tax=Aplanochytrium stocchinoi TaxID=215587 RepID=A0A7S3PP17_9STRA|mmetsp:Transcript_4883/g.6174  ORF Transcript_4883/g.6174 Transcript_4883/m.6174 type:complete len:272 (-) Transcript_4883:671-1486(-)